MEEYGFQRYDVIQILQETSTGEKWIDFSTIRDAEDAHYSQKMVDGTHRTFRGTYRIVRRGEVVYPKK